MTKKIGILFESLPLLTYARNKFWKENLFLGKYKEKSKMSLYLRRGKIKKNIFD